MRSARARAALLLVGLAVIVGLPLVGWWARQDAVPRCALDGLDIEPRYRVRVTDDAGSYEFCCTRCAEQWLARHPGPAAVFVTDEAGGDEIDARAATFVRSPVITNRVTGNRVHAFRNRADAEAHARQFGGWVLRDGERPFRGDAPP
jgi:hypothetical protein